MEVRDDRLIRQTLIAFSLAKSDFDEFKKSYSGRMSCIHQDPAAKNCIGKVMDDAQSTTDQSNPYYDFDEQMEMAKAEGLICGACSNLLDYKKEIKPLKKAFGIQKARVTRIANRVARGDI